MTLNGVCVRDREYARHVARVWAEDAAWEDFRYFLPWSDTLAPIEAPPDMVPFGRRHRESADFSRRAVAHDWIKNGHTYAKPIRHY